MPARGIQHVDLTVEDVEQSLAFYKELLGPLGWDSDRGVCEAPPEVGKAF
jgi:catechol 2,3-dioxygenase-like lactoylglutathione lyase family enzyme